MTTTGTLTPTATTVGTTPTNQVIPAPRDPIAWNYPRFRLAEGLATIAGGGISLGFLLHNPHVSNATQGGILFDDSIRSSLRARSQAGIDRAQLASAIPYYIGLSYPLVVDVVGVTWLGRGHDDTALEMALIDVEAYSYAGALSYVSNGLVRRSRPLATDCLRSHHGSQKACGGEGGANVESFYSGHTSLTFTGAALTCAHHRAIPLYGGGVPDGLVCGLLLAASVVDGVGRLYADQHYATDVITGALVGSAIGFLTPTLLHYRYPIEKLGGFMVMPSFSTTYAGMAATSIL